jgi:hypothetical protein
LWTLELFIDDLRSLRKSAGLPGANAVAELCVATALTVLLLPLPLRLCVRASRVALIPRTLLCSLSCCPKTSLTVLTP